MTACPNDVGCKERGERVHRHHIIPKHMGGSDAADNLTPPISIEEHAKLHRELWEQHHRREDYIAWSGLSGRMTLEEARLAAAKLGQDRSERYKQSRKNTGACAKAAATFETRSLGGRRASAKLVAWQRENASSFRAQCAENARSTCPKLRIPHEYRGITYPSKMALQEAHHLSNCGFYGKLKRGEIVRLQREIERREKQEQQG